MNSDWNSSSGVSQILNKPNLATVATSGDYDDLQNKPTIPTNVSDLNNDSGFITSWGQADWNQTDNSASDYIKNKPTIPQAVQSYSPGNYSDFYPAGYVDDNFARSTTVVQSDWNESSIYSNAYIKNKPTIPAAQVNSDWDAVSGVAQILNKPSLATVATSGDYDDLTNTPTIPAAQVNSDWNSSSGVSEILNKPSLATVATSGSYNDLSNTPTIPTNVSDLNNDSGFITSWGQADWNQSDNTASDYIKNKPTIPSAQVNSDWNSSSGVSEILNKPTIPTQAVAIASGDSGYATGDQVYQVVGDIESLLAAI